MNNKKVLKKSRKTIKKIPNDNKQIVEIHIYVHNGYSNVPTITQHSTFPPYNTFS